jgi:hypothetical protein
MSGARERCVARCTQTALGLIVVSLPLLDVLVTRSFAQDTEQRQRAPAPTEIIIGGDKSAPAPPAASERCVEIQIGQSKSMDCLNQQLKQKVDRVNPPIINQPPLDARSPDTKIGVINVPGVQQQYGKNFGVSAVPFRPPPPVFAAPFAGRHRCETAVA